MPRPRDDAEDECGRDLAQRRVYPPPRGRHPSITTLRKGDSRAPIHAAQNLRTVERYSYRRAARRGDLANPARPTKTVINTGLLHHAAGQHLRRYGMRASGASGLPPATPREGDMTQRIGRIDACASVVDSPSCCQLIGARIPIIGANQWHTISPTPPPRTPRESLRNPA
jgi:hypothetical protein